MNLESGISVSIVEEARRKLLRFDRPVQLVEIKDDEALRIASKLIEGIHRVSMSDEVRSLKSEGFFSEEKSLSDIHRALANKSVVAQSSVLSTILTRLVEKSELLKAGSPGNYRYTTQKGK